MRTRAQVACFKYFVGKTFSVYIQQKLLTITLEKERADCLTVLSIFVSLVLAKIAGSIGWFNLRDVRRITVK